jgi:hypothetical protein
MSSLNRKNGMSALYKDGLIIVQCGNGVELKFPVSGNPRLAHGTPEQLNNIQVSPFGLHWPDLDEDLSLGGLLKGDYGQSQVDTCRIAEQPAGYMGSQGKL